MKQNKPRILITESKDFSPTALKIIEKVGDVRLEELDRASLIDTASNSEILWVRLRHSIDSEVMDSAPNLRVIVSPTTGLNHIDLDEAKKRNIEFLSLRGESVFLENIRATAEHTVALLLSLLRNIPKAFDSVMFGEWDRMQFKGNELYRKKVGLVGYGRIGKLVARYLEPFDCSIRVCDPGLNREDIPPHLNSLNLDDLLRNSDIVLLLASWNEENDGFFNSDIFTQMKKGCWFINTSRGELVDEHALLSALQSGRLAGAAIDVVHSEQELDMNPQFKELVNYASLGGNLLITPHLSGCTYESMAETEIFMAEKLEHWLAAASC